MNSEGGFVSIWAVLLGAGLILALLRVVSCSN